MDTPYEHEHAAGEHAAALRDGGRRNFVVVHNARAGRAGHAHVEMVLARLAAAGARTLLVEATGERDPVARVAGQIDGGSVDAVVAAGGDGTIRRLLPALAGRSVPLGIIPVGTGNVLFRELALPSRPGALTHALLHGPTREIGGATANGEPFLLMCGVGFDGRIIGALDQAAKSRLGKLAYVVPIARAMTQPVDALEVVADGREHFAAWAIVTNVSRYAGGHVLTRRTHACVGGLQLVLFKSERRLELVARAMDLLRGRLDARAESHGDVVMLACRDVTLRSRTPAAVQVDGDPIGTTPVTVLSATGPRIKVILPPQDAARH